MDWKCQHIKNCTNKSNGIKWGNGIDKNSTLNQGTEFSRKVDWNKIHWNSPTILSNRFESSWDTPKTFLRLPEIPLNPIERFPHECSWDPQRLPWDHLKSRWFLLRLPETSLRSHDAQRPSKTPGNAHEILCSTLTFSRDPLKCPWGPLRAPGTPWA